MPQRLRAVTGNRILLSSSSAFPSPHTIIISPEDGSIKAIIPSRLAITDARLAHLALTPSTYRDFKNSLVTPGVVDAHVHLNDPGRTHWEGFQTGTQAAIMGGVTTVVDMPLNSIPPTVNVAAFGEKMSVATMGGVWCDTAFWGGVIPGNKSELLELTRAGVRGFKCFLCHSGVDEFPRVDHADVLSAMEILQDTNAVLMFHAEMDPQVDIIAADLNPASYQTFLAARPASLELRAIETIIDAMRKYPKTRCHIVHLATAEALPMINAARKDGLSLTAETCTHYLGLVSDKAPVKDGAVQYKCCPPVRTSETDGLWQGLFSGDIAFIASDHSPCPPELKGLDSAGCGQGDFLAGWGGISSIGLTLPLVWTLGEKYGITLNQVLQWLCEAPAAHAMLDARKGRLAVGMDADMVVWDETEEWVIGKQSLGFKHKLSAWEGRRVRGRVHATLLRGSAVYQLGDGIENASSAGEPCGIILLTPVLERNKACT